MLLGGYANKDAKLNVPIHETELKAGCLASLPPGSPTASCYDPNKGRPEFQTLQVWRKSGPVFAGLGGGLMIPTGPAGGVIVEVKFEALFGNSGLSLSPSVGYAFGL